MMTVKSNSDVSGRDRWPGSGSGVVGLAWLAAGLGLALLLWLLGPASLAEARGRAAAPDGGANDTIRMTFQVSPPGKARVMLGHKLLGLINGPRKPLTVTRPRDSGPLDITVRADGYLPVHTRAYSFTDSHVTVKMTPIADKRLLFGYREEAASVPDGGTTNPADGGVLLPVVVPH